jgi:hypothetical protein
MIIVSEYDPGTNKFTGRVLSGTEELVELNKIDGMSYMSGQFIPETHEIVNGQAVAIPQQLGKPYWLR